MGQAKEDNRQPTPRSDRDEKSMHPSRSNSNSSQAHQDSQQAESSQPNPTNLLSDKNYEFLFNQLLEGVAHGWHDRRIIKFFQQLGDRGKQEDWIAWLNRVRAKLLSLPIGSKRQLGTMMIRLGESTRSAREINQFSTTVRNMGRELLFGTSPTIIWEYNGADATPENSNLALETEQELSQRSLGDLVGLSTDNVETESASTVEQRLERKGLSPMRPSPVSEVISDHSQSNTDSVDASASGLINSEPPDNLANQNNSGVDRSLTDTKDNDQDPVAIDMQQVMNLIQEDDELAQQIFQKLNLALPQVPNRQTIQPHQQLGEPDLELVESWFNLGLKQVSACEFERAIASWEKALKINPNLAEAWHNRGSALGRIGNYEAAVESFQNALIIDSNNYQAWNDRAHALYQLGNWAEAVNSWSYAIKIMPSNHLFWYHRGTALEQLERWTEAIASYEKALEIKPDFQPGRSRYINLVADNSRSN